MESKLAKEINLKRLTKASKLLRLASKSGYLRDRCFANRHLPITPDELIRVALYQVDYALKIEKEEKQIT